MGRPELKRYVIPAEIVVVADSEETARGVAERMPRTANWNDPIAQGTYRTEDGGLVGERTLVIRPSDPGDHLDFVHVVEVEGREDGIYVFGHHHDARRFAAIANRDRIGARMSAWITETPINTGAAVERLIASERADVLEGMGWPTVAGHVREGAPWGRVLSALAGADATGRATRLLQHWAEEDAKGGQS